MMKETMIKGLLAAALLLSPAARAAAQTGGQQPNPADEGLKGVVLKNRAPVNKEVLKVKLPRAQEATLKNGLRVVLLESRRVPNFTMQLVVTSGGLSDPADHKGLAQFTAALLREGTAKRTSRQLAEELDTMGASVAAFGNLSGFTSTVSASGLVENLDPVLDIFADVVRNPSFPKEEVEKYKTRTAAQLQARESNVRVKRLLSPWATRVREDLAHARGADADLLRPLNVLAALHRRLLDRIAAHDYDVAARRIELGPVEKPWVAWRAARAR